MYYFTDARIKAIAESGLKCNISEGLLAFDPALEYKNMPICKKNTDLVRDYHNAFDGRLKIDLCIHAEYTSNPNVVRAVGEAAYEMGVQTHIHLSETQAEHEECKERHGGLSPAQYFDSLDFFKAPCTAAHCVWVSDSDIELLAKRGVTVATNPVSNLKLASGVAPVPKMLSAGVNVALGTDGCASNNNHNIMQDLYLLALLHKGVNYDPTLITPAQALNAATAAGAAAQGRFLCGQIKEGYHADLVVLDTALPWTTPDTDPLGNIIYASQGSDVVLTMVDGVTIYRDGEYHTIDIERARAEVAAHTKRIAQIFVNIAPTSNLLSQ
jgi:5-methylthioadenosine/S-adenosylhomocysteine deaminase